MHHLSSSTEQILITTSHKVSRWTGRGNNLWGLWQAAEILHFAELSLQDSSFRAGSQLAMSILWGEFHVERVAHAARVYTHRGDTFQVSCANWRLASQVHFQLISNYQHQIRDLFKKTGVADFLNSVAPDSDFLFHHNVLCSNVLVNLFQTACYDLSHFLMNSSFCEDMSSVIEQRTHVFIISLRCP